MSKTDTYDIITERLIAKIESGTIPWQRPWTSATNAVSKKAYRGINALMLGCSSYTSPYWATYKQAATLGGQVKKGAKSEIVVYFTILEKRDKTTGEVQVDAKGRKKGIPFLRYSNVFNLDQIDGIELKGAKVQAVGEDLDCTKAKEIYDAAKEAKRIPHVVAEGSRACYSPSLDVIKMPSMATFNACASYYHTLFHELVHATGHKSRLDRQVDNGFGDEPYAKEELIAELGASFISNDAGILGNVAFDNSAGYLQNWIAALKNDTKLIVSASSAAQRASEYIQGINQQAPETPVDNIAG